MRKGHGSTKIPNVKLRPAPKKKNATSSAAIASTSATQNDAIDEETEQERLKSKDLPFEGIVLAQTGVENKSEIFKLATAMGAISSLHFTDMTTHLVAQEPGSAKYSVAAERGIPILKPSWITDTHALWIQGENIVIEDTIQQHRLKPFHGLSIAVTWMDDVSKRQEISDGIPLNGGKYAKTVTSKDGSPEITHLLCGGDGGEDSEKLRWARKLNQRAEKGEGDMVAIVWEEWYWDCVAFGGRLPETKYNITKPRPQRREPPKRQIPKAGSALSGRPKIVVQQSFIDLTGPTSAGDDVIVGSSRLARVGSQRVLEEILKTRKDWKVDGGKLGCDTPDLSTVPKGEAKESGKVETATDDLPALKRVTDRSAGFLSKEGEPSKKKRTSLKRIISQQSIPPPLNPEPPALKSDLFDGTKFALIGEADAPHIVAKLTRCGAIILPDPLAVDFIIVRLASGGKFYTKADPHVRVKIRSECWLERCFGTSTICGVNEHLLFRPLTVTLPLKDERLKSMKVNWSGLDLEQISWAKRVCAALGLTVPEKFTNQTTHLICPDRTGAKYDNAIRLKMEVVDLQWLWNLARTGSLACVEKGKMKAFSQGADSRQITDITNGRSVPPILHPSPVDEENPFLRNYLPPLTSSPKRKRPRESEPSPMPSPGLALTSNHTGEDDDGLALESPQAEPPAGCSPRLKRARTLSQQPSSSSSKPKPMERSSTEGTASMSLDTESLGVVEQYLKKDKSTTTVPSSVTASPSTPLSTREALLTTKEDEKPPQLRSAASRELRHTITEILTATNDNDSEMVSEEINQNSRRPRPKRSRSQRSLTATSPTSSHQPRSMSGQASAVDLPPSEKREETSKGIDNTEAKVNQSVLYKDPAQEAAQSKLLKLLTMPKSEVKVRAYLPRTTGF